MTMHSPKDHQSPPNSTAEGFENARISNLLHFASLTPDQRVQWLVDTLEIMAEVQGRLDENAVDG